MIKFNEIITESDHVNSSYELFMSEIQKLGGTINGKLVSFQGLGTATLSYVDDCIDIATIYVPSWYRKQGAGTKIMNIIIQAADATHVSLALTPVPFGNEKGLNKAGLKKWYKKFGFKTHYDEMIRPAH